MTNKVKKENFKLVSIDDIHVNPKNNNDHPADQIDQLKKQITFQGFRDPLCISLRSGLLVCGEGRLIAAKELGYKELPCIYEDFDSEEQEYAYMTAHNAINRWSEINFSKINSELENLGPDFDIDLLGIKDFKIDPVDILDDFEVEKDDKKKYILEIQFPNEMEMMDIHDDLVPRGYVVKIK